MVDVFIQDCVRIVSMKTQSIVLASTSPRRQQMLSWAGWKFDIAPARVDETPFEKEIPGRYVVRLAESKARAVLSIGKQKGIIVAADTTVVDEKSMLGKPTSRDEAIGMLRRLRGRTHFVYTAIAVLDSAQSNIFTDLCVSQVKMRQYSDDEIITYVNSGDPFDKAGGYAIQHPDFNPVIDFNDCYANVVGLPLCHLVRTLRQLDIVPNSDIPLACRDYLGYTCAIFQSILWYDYQPADLRFSFLH